MIVAPGDRDALIATGFCRCGPREVVGGNVIPEVKRQSELTEITGTVGSVFLGLTIGCARCHDHKFDAIPTTDYYRLQAFFAASELTDVPIASENEREAYAAAKKAIEQKVAPSRKQLATLEAPYRAALKASEAVDAQPRGTRRHEHARQRTARRRRSGWPRGWKRRCGSPGKRSPRRSRPTPPTTPGASGSSARSTRSSERFPRPPAHAMALVDQKSKATDTFVLRRGDYKNRGPKVAPAAAGRDPGLAARRLVSRPRSKATGDKTGRRAALAKWLTDPDNPLTARVIVNRLWQYHFGRGIVATSSDFGVRGEPPSHPELLDWLASELVAGGWRLKPLHRLMVTSATYRQSNKSDPKLAADDPENTLFGRMNRRRLDAEGVRDAMLAVSGELNPKMGGPGRARAARKGGQGPDLHRGRGRRPLARGPRPHRTRPALALSLPQAQRALPALRRLRRTRHPERLPPPRHQHPRPPGTDAA